jgi:hypothetical protein
MTDKNWEYVIIVNIEHLYINGVGVEVLTAVLINPAIFWDVVLCSLYVHRWFGATHHLHLQGWKSAEQETSM